MTQPENPYNNSNNQNFNGQNFNNNQYNNPGVNNNQQGHNFNNPNKSSGLSEQTQDINNKLQNFFNNLNYDLKLIFSIIGLIVPLFVFVPLYVARKTNYAFTALILSIINVLAGFVFFGSTISVFCGLAVFVLWIIALIQTIQVVYPEYKATKEQNEKEHREYNNIYNPTNDQKNFEQ